jgi:hypothetical protein
MCETNGFGSILGNSAVYCVADGFTAESQHNARIMNLFRATLIEHGSATQTAEYQAGETR